MFNGPGNISTTASAAEEMQSALFVHFKRIAD